MDHTPYDDQADLSPEIKLFAEADEDQCKREAFALLREYYLGTTWKDYEAKYDKGVAEHGPVTEKKLMTMNWFYELVQEFKDSFWFVVFCRFRLSRAGKLQIGQPCMWSGDMFDATCEPFPTTSEA